MFGHAHSVIVKPFYCTNSSQCDSYLCICVFCRFVCLRAVGFLNTSSYHIARQEVDWLQCENDNVII